MVQARMSLGEAINRANEIFSEENKGRDLKILVVKAILNASKFDNTDSEVERLNAEVATLKAKIMKAHEALW